MSNTAVITGDMINSKYLSNADRDKFIDIFSNYEELLQFNMDSNVDLFRGDSFQLRITNPLDSLKSAIIIRSLFRSQSSQDNHQWDCRLSLGIGNSEFEKSTPGISDGEAYRLSGYGLDEIKKKRLVIATPWRDINEELTVVTAFADDLISHWTIKQSKVMLHKLRLQLPNSELAELMQVSRQAIDKLTHAAKYNLIELYLNRFHYLLSHKL